MIEVRDLSRGFGDFALSHIDLRADSGSYTVVLGPSGCGKSLLLKTLAGLFQPESGTIHINGIDVTTLAAEHRPVGLVFQEPSLFPHRNVPQNIAYGLEVTGVSRAERESRVAELVSLLRLDAVRERRVNDLSGGEAQRVALARSLAVRPEVLLLDEPLSQVDENTRLELQGELKRLHGELGLTTLHVTHSREEAAALADNGAVMLGGRILQAGAFSEIREAPTCAFVAWFMGSERTIERPDGCDESCLGAGAGRCKRLERS